jgi:assimilatory nitrate reductase catalytic subunit
LICACNGVCLGEIEEALRQGSASVEDVGRALRAGTNCGSCKPEIRKIIEACGANLLRPEFVEPAQ